MDSSRKVKLKTGTGVATPGFELELEFVWEFRLD